MSPPPPRTPGRGGGGGRPRVVREARPAARPAPRPRQPPGEWTPRTSTGRPATGGRTPNPRTANPRTPNPRTANPRAAGSRAATPKPPAPKAAGAKAANPRSANPRSANPRSANPRSASARPAPVRRPPPRPPRRVGRPPRLGSSRRRLRVAALGLAVLLLALVGRLTQLQGFEAAAYARKAELQRLHTVALPAPRGTITDRDGATLAVDVDARAVYADPSVVVDRPRTAALLAPLLKLPAADLLKKLGQPGRFVYLARGLDPAVGTAVSELFQKEEMPGIGVLDERRRLYPSGSLAANLVGFTISGAGGSIVGGGGIESAYNSILRGTDGERQLQEDNAGVTIASAEQHVREPVAGEGVRLTIDRDIQWEAQTALASAVSSTKSDSGTVVVLDRRSGDILAMADAPSFNPNDVADADPAALGNLATSTPYEPGSVNKVITMAGAIDRGLITPETPVTVPPTLRVGNRSYHDAEVHGTEHLTAAGVLAKSSNIGTIEIAQRLGSSALESELRRFGLGATTGVNFPGESQGVLPPSSQWSTSQATTIPYGQGMSATALQMASVYATIANGGIRVTPRLVAATISPDGTVHPTPPSTGVRVVSAATATTVTQMLEQVTGDGGTAPAAQIAGYRVAGKTGTADRVDPTCHCYRGYTASFVGFAPADDPSVVVEVVLDNPRSGHFGGEIAAPVFTKVMSFALATQDAPPTGRRPPSLLLDLDHGR